MVPRAGTSRARPGPARGYPELVYQKQGELRAHMGESQDVRVARTRARLMTAYRELLEEGAGPITVSAVTRRAGVTRSTFYTHFTGASDLAASALGEYIEHVIDLSRSSIRAGESKRDANTRAVTLMLTFVSAQHAALERLFAEDDVFIQAVENALAVSARRCLLARLPVYGDPEVTARFTAAGVVRTMAWWLREKKNVPATEMAELIIRSMAVDFVGE